MLHKSFHDRIDVGFAWDLVERFSVQPREQPADANRGAEIIAERLRSAGVPVTIHEPTLFLSLPGPASVEVAGTRFNAKPPAFSAIVSRGLTAPMEYMAPTRHEFARHQRLDPDRYRGKIVVTEGISLPMLTSEIEEMGALGIIAVNPGERIHWSTASTIWGTPGVDDMSRLPKIPSAGVNRGDGAVILAAAKSGAAATIRTELEQGWFPQKLPVVHIDGATEPDRFVFLHGHYDSWQVGVGDNGTGNACMLEVARVLWQMRRNLRRSVRLAWWPAHSTGRYGGSAWYLDAHAADFAKQCVLHMNCDSPGCRLATEYSALTMMPETVATVAALVERVTGQTPKAKRPNRSSDYTFYNIGISGALMASSMMPAAEVQKRGWHHVGGCGGNIAWHTEDDTMEIADKGVLAKDIALYLEAVVTFASAEVLPFDFRDTVREVAVAVEGYVKAAGKRLDLTPVSRSLGELAVKIDAFHRSVAEKKIAPRAANEAMRELSRALVPLNYARGGPYEQDPAVTLPPVPLLSIAADLDVYDKDTIGFALATLLRGRNAALDAIDRANAAVTRAMAN
jgi:N-acetylated-alpha-linked acidic dipeptidase